MFTETLLAVGTEDDRVVKFYENAAKTGPEGRRVYCDSVAKKIKLQKRP